MAQSEENARVDAELGAASGAYAQGDAGTALRHCERVFDLTTDPEAWAQAALLVHGVGGELNAVVAGLCDRALAVLPPADGVLRARVAAQRVLAVGELLGGAAVDAESVDALDIAVASGDSQALVRALQARHFAISAPDRTHERVALSERMLLVAAAHGDADAELWGRLWRVDTAFELGDPTTLRDQVARLELLAARSGWGLAQWHAHRLRAALGLLIGDFAGARTEAERARQAANRTGDSAHQLLLELLEFEYRNLTGRLPELVDRVRAFALGFGQQPIAWSNGGAVLLAAGDLETALTCHERLRPVLGELAFDGRWLYTVVGAGELAMAFEDGEVISWCRRSLLPYVDRFQASAGGTIVCRGSVGRLVGELTLRCGEVDDAVDLLTAAVAEEKRAGAVPYRSLSQLSLAEALVRRGRSEDTTRARDLLDQVTSAARRLEPRHRDDPRHLRTHRRVPRWQPAGEARHDEPYGGGDMGAPERIRQTPGPVPVVPRGRSPPHAIRLSALSTRGTTMDDPSLMSAVELTGALRRREISSRELLGHYLRRIEKDPGGINAVITVDEQSAISQASDADEALARGEHVGPLCGLPTTVKDTIETAGLRTTAGAPELAGHLPHRDADAVSRLRAAGAVIFGKTNTPPFAVDFQTINPLFGRTNNPWDQTRTPGGSAGGSAAALAAGHTGFELGSDLAGSIRIPASNCGVYGLKPSHGLVPTRGHIPGPPGTLAEPDLATIGPLSRSADDLALGLDVLAGPDFHSARAWRLDLPAPRGERLRDYRLGVLLDDPYCPVDSAVLDVLTSLLDALRTAGARMAHVQPPAPLAETDPLFQQTLAGVTAAFLPAPNLEFFQALAVGADPGDKSPLTQWARWNVQSVRDWWLARERRAQLRVKWADFFRDYDALLCPVSNVPPIPHDDSPEPALRTILVNGQPTPYMTQSVWSGLATVADLPAVAVPAGLTDSNLPVGVQILAPYLEDRTAIDVARHIEAAIGRFVAPPSSEPDEESR